MKPEEKLPEPPTAGTQHELLLQAIWDHSLDALLLTAPDGRILAANPAACTLFGRPEADLCRLGRNGLLDLNDPHLADALTEREHTGQVRRELTFLRADGSRFFGEVTSSVFTDADGQTRTSMIIRDITGRKRTAEELQESEEQYRNLFEYMFSGFVLLEVLFDDAGNPVDHRLLQANAEFDRMTGLKRSEEIGRTSATLGFKWPAEVAQRYYQIALGGEPLHWERFNDSLQRYYELRVFSPRRGQIAVLFSDITERKQTAAALRQSEERLRLVMEATHDGVWDWNLQSNLAHLSPHYYELTGYQPGEVVPNLAFFKQLVHPDDFPLLLERITEHLQGRTEQSIFDYRLVTKSGAIRWVLSRGRVVERDGAGTALRMVGTITDITGRKQAEAELAASQAALRELAARVQTAREEERRHIARQIHDELGHAFTDLKLDLAWLDRRLAERKLTRRTKARQKITEMIQRVEADLNTARALSTNLRPAMLDTLGLAATLEWAVEQFERRTRTPYRLDLPAHFPPLATDRAAALFRAFQEILTNVTRHASATAVRVRLAAAAGQVTLEVSDNGRGITMQERDDPHAIGLLGLRERALEFGGTVEIGGSPATGTHIRISIPSGVP